MTDCKREEIWESAKRRKVMKGFSNSALLQEVKRDRPVFLPSGEGSDGYAMA